MGTDDVNTRQSSGLFFGNDLHHAIQFIENEGLAFCAERKPTDLDVMKCRCLSPTYSFSNSKV
jgi:hypothetical protein